RNRTAISMALGGAAALAAFELLPVLQDTIGGGDVAPVPVTPDITPVPVVPPTPEVNNFGFNPHVIVEHGHGYIKELQDLADQQGHHLSIAQATDAYHQVLSEQGTNFFTDNQNQLHLGDNWISRPGASTWDHAHLASFHAWLQAQEDANLVA
ncbi:MAG: hypothetical protein ABIV43_01810, partial [Candidatus Saccharimonadales bacterium]